jgi:hypothetical protein
MISSLILPGLGALHTPRFSLIMELAARWPDCSNPASGVRLPRSTESEKRYLTKAEVFRLADACKNVTVTHGKDYRALVLTPPARA